MPYNERMGVPAYPDLCAVLLAGGSSRRMGRDKALIEVGGKTLLQRLSEMVRPLASEVLISCSDTERYGFLDLPIVPDVYPGQGPLAGLHAAILRTRKNFVLLLACDMPNLSQRLLRGIVESAVDCDAVIPRTSDGRIHPLCGAYGRSCLDLIEAQLVMGKNRVADFLSLPSLRVRYFESHARGFPDSDFLNLNDERDLPAFCPGS